MEKFFGYQEIQCDDNRQWDYFDEYDGVLVIDVFINYFVIFDLIGVYGFICVNFYFFINYVEIYICCIDKLIEMECG